MKKFNTQTLVTLGLLVAAEVVLSRFLSINAWNIRIGFAFVPIALSAYLFGPMVTALVAAVSDIIGAILFPTGPYFPGFTITAILMGLSFGFFLYKKSNLLKIVIAVAINQFILGMVLNSFFISILYGSPYLPLVATRSIQSIILFVIQVAVIKAMEPFVLRMQKMVKSEA